MKKKICGEIIFQSEIEIEELGRILSKEIFANLEFIGLNEYIYDEVPAIYIKEVFLNHRIILSGYKGFIKNKWYVLEFNDISGCICFNKSFETLNIDDYLIDIFKKKLIDYDIKYIFR